MSLQNIQPTTNPPNLGDIDSLLTTGYNWGNRYNQSLGSTGETIGNLLNLYGNQVREEEGVIRQLSNTYDQTRRELIELENTRQQLVRDYIRLQSQLQAQGVQGVNNAALRDTIARLEDEILRMTGDIEARTRERDDLRAQLQQAQARANEAQNLVTQLEQRIRQLEQERQAQLNQQTLNQNLLNQLQTLINDARNRYTGLQQEITGSESGLNQYIAGPVRTGLGNISLNNYYSELVRQVLERRLYNAFLLFAQMTTLQVPDEAVQWDQNAYNSQLAYYRQNPTSDLVINDQTNVLDTLYSIIAYYAAQIHQRADEFVRDLQLPSVYSQSFNANIELLRQRHHQIIDQAVANVATGFVNDGLEILNDYLDIREAIAQRDPNAPPESIARNICQCKNSQFIPLFHTQSWLLTSIFGANNPVINNISLSFPFSRNAVTAAQTSVLNIDNANIRITYNQFATRVGELPIEALGGEDDAVLFDLLRRILFYYFQSLDSGSMLIEEPLPPLSIVPVQPTPAILSPPQTPSILPPLQPQPAPLQQPPQIPALQPTAPPQPNILTLPNIQNIPLQAIGAPSQPNILPIQQPQQLPAVTAPQPVATQPTVQPLPIVQTLPATSQVPEQPPEEGMEELEFLPPLPGEVPGTQITYPTLNIPFEQLRILSSVNPVNMPFGSLQAPPQFNLQALTGPQQQAVSPVPTLPLLQDPFAQLFEQQGEFPAIMQGAATAPSAPPLSPTFTEFPALQGQFPQGQQIVPLQQQQQALAQLTPQERALLAAQALAAAQQQPQQQGLPLLPGSQQQQLAPFQQQQQLAQRPLSPTQQELVSRIPSLSQIARPQ